MDIRTEATTNDTLDFGVDAPSWIRNSVILAIIATAAGVGTTVGGVKIVPIVAFAAAVLLLALLGGIILSSKVIKPAKCRQMVDLARLNGTEEVLDIGCGRGMLLIEAARRLTAGKATGIDIWSERDQSGNSADATRSNVSAAGLASRAEVADGDARDLPFSDASFDLIVSSLTFHNIANAKERERAIREVVRVLRPDGKAVILDMLHTRAYAKIMRTALMDDVRRSRPFFLHFLPSRIVTAQKPKTVRGNSSS